ncbi:alkaline shock response membrane anchor protein AmaP [Brevibacillus parabrevis]|uniref:alkaline shock response membrane anchor protein AmaP n=1 Tax=Brevibacillus parabrevis TaxID=54914 RepID=UPI0028D33819|nr:alkaline shock response membrane anchor protein AmaP [Brevibacillus parabrevis]MED1724082.1 alkaline shock response membrane anchor protein AmaP [Brevibacillus parabrevis]
MHVNLFDRFILTIYSFALIVLSCIAIAATSGLVPSEFFQPYVDQMLAGTNITYLIVAIIFLIVSLRFFFSSFRSSKPKVDRGIRQRSDLGEVNITIQTIQTIAERAARRVKGVRDMKTTVKALESGNIITLRVSVDGETPLPELTQKLQADVKEQVEGIAGVVISEVAVVVTEVAQQENYAARKRVE